MNDTLNTVKYTIKSKIQALMPWTAENAKLFEQWLEVYRETAEKQTGLNILVQVGSMGSGLVVASVAFFRGAVVDACLDGFLAQKGEK